MRHINTLAHTGLAFLVAACAGAPTRAPEQPTATRLPQDTPTQTPYTPATETPLPPRCPDGYGALSFTTDTGVTLVDYCPAWVQLFPGTNTVGSIDGDPVLVEVTPSPDGVHAESSWRSGSFAIQLELNTISTIYYRGNMKNGSPYLCGPLLIGSKELPENVVADPSLLGACTPLGDTFQGWEIRPMTHTQ